MIASCIRNKSYIKDAFSRRIRICNPYALIRNQSYIGYIPLKFCISLKIISEDLIKNQTFCNTLV